MALPFFYISHYKNEQQVMLDEDTSRHVVQVLRMKTGEQLNLTDGRGNLLTCVITEVHKKHCTVAVKETQYIEPPKRKISIAISLLKNANRFEWFLEKATEIGVNEIIPLVCERTEKEKFRYDRMEQISVSAMLQSQQTWLPAIHDPVQFEDLVFRQFDNDEKLIAHCLQNDKISLSNHQITKSSNQLILIGPEGDFTRKEIELALTNQFVPVSLGETRLRTETAGIVAATLLCL
ncbi:MAG TPA: RsmE family RNA methyltransferase [Chitinophagaceae bacterium]|nr:RsmE family RNA methyltransferase [Chitinophagaceae bacterium]HNU13144.1 RsmE family RNA methyltransferase [Chitinophagaceae bacterium]